MVSADYSVRKPNPLLFETAAAKLGVAPENIWFVGDQLDLDIEGAKSAGMKAVWLNPLESAAVDGPVLRFATWHEIIEYFRISARACNSETAL
jgi:putative hydrolase of the HAD superfamily